MAPGGAVVAVGAEHPHELGDDLRLGELETDARVGSAPVSLTIEKCRAPSEAICGRCVMHSTWPRSPSSRSRAPTALAVRPPMPGVDLVEDQRRLRRGRALAALMIASITRESSPPEAISRSGPGGTPGFGAIVNSTVSAPRGPGSASPRARPRSARPPSPASAAARRRPWRSAGRPCGAPRAAPRRARRAPRAAAASSARRCSIATSAPASSSRRARARGGELEHRLDAAAVLADHALERLQARFDRLEVRLDARHVELVEAGTGAVVAQLRAELLGLDRGGAQPLGEPLERRVHAGDRLERGARAGEQLGGAGLLPVLSEQRPGGARRGGA